jgi:endonuclease YncB( thermonuclease family)
MERCIAALRDFHPEASNRYTLAGLNTVGKVLSVYDGDSVTLALVLEHHVPQIKWAKARLNGIDAPELKPLLSIDNRSDVVNKAKASRDRLKELVESNPDCIVRVHVHGEDKYGRLLVSLFPLALALSAGRVASGGSGSGLHEASYNAQLVREEHALLYDGGRKKR